MACYHSGLANMVHKLWSWCQLDNSLLTCVIVCCRLCATTAVWPTWCTSSGPGASWTTACSPVSPLSSPHTLPPARQVITACNDVERQHVMMLYLDHPRIIHTCMLYYHLANWFRRKGHKKNTQIHCRCTWFIQFYLCAKKSASNSHKKAPNHCSYSWVHASAIKRWQTLTCLHPSVQNTAAGILMKFYHNALPNAELLTAATSSLAYTSATAGATGLSPNSLVHAIIKHAARGGLKEPVQRALFNLLANLALSSECRNILWKVMFFNDFVS